MKANKICIEFNNFKPTRETTVFLKDELERLQYSSPSDALLKLEITRNNSRWFGELLVVSTVGRFYSSHQNSSITGVALQLLTDMKGQLRRWSYIKSFVQRKAC